MMERDNLVTYNLSLETQQRLYHKAENARLAKLVSAEKFITPDTVVGALGAVSIMLILILFM
jgi:hypothetical protein